MHETSIWATTVKGTRYELHCNAASINSMPTKSAAEAYEISSGTNTLISTCGKLPLHCAAVHDLAWSLLQCHSTKMQCKLHPAVLPRQGCCYLWKDAAVCCFWEVTVVIKKRKRSTPDCLFYVTLNRPSLARATSQFLGMKAQWDVTHNTWGWHGPPVLDGWLLRTMCTCCYANHGYSMWLH